MFFLIGFFLSSLFIPQLSQAASPAPDQPLVINEKYDGGFKDDFAQELPRVRLMADVAHQEIAAQLGLFQNGRNFFHPVLLRFADGAPQTAENRYFYTQPKNDAAFAQELVANVEAFAHTQRGSRWDENEFKSGFYYAMAKGILNDIAGGDTDVPFPTWVQEGAAVFCSGGGEAMVKRGAQEFRSRNDEEIGDLNRPGLYVTKRDWANYYLAIKYISDKGGVDGLQGFIRNLANGQSTADAIRNTLGQEWPEFEKNVREYAAAAFANFLPSEKPYRPRVPSPSK